VLTRLFEDKTSFNAVDALAVETLAGACREVGPRSDYGPSPGGSPRGAYLVKTKPRACISRFFYIVITIAIGQKTGGEKSFCHGDYHGSGQNTVLRLMGFCQVITMAVRQKTGSGEGFCHGDTMAVGQKTGSGEGFSHGDTMAVGQTRF